MAKILTGLLAAIVIAAAGFFGFQFYVQQRVAGEVETAFAQIRAKGGKASHGRVTFDLLKRVVTVADITGESSAQPPVSVKIASVTASGVSQPDTTRFSAETIEATDIEISAALAVPATGGHISYKAPRITVKDYSGPVNLAAPPAASSPIELYRFALTQFAGISASSVSLPSLGGSLDFGNAAPAKADIAYSDFAADGIKDGKIATIKIAEAVFTVNTQQAGKTDKLTGHLANVASYDIDTSAMAAVLDPNNANDDTYHRAYRQISAGPYELDLAQGQHAHIEGMTIDDLGLRPSRLQIPAILAMMPAAGTVPTPAQAREMIEKVAGLYEGVRVGNLEIRGLSTDTPQGPFKLAAMRYNLDGGKGDFAIEGLDAPSPKGPIRVQRFAIKSVDFAGFFRTAALFSNPAQRPAPDQALRLLTMIEGAEVKGLVAPFKDTNRQVKIDNISLDWGQFVGPIPTKAHLIAKMVTPIDATDPAQSQLIAAGLDMAALDADLGAAWTEASGVFALDPLTIDIGGIAKATAHISLAHVPRGVFSPNPQQAAAMAAQIEAGTLELTLRDSGGVDLLVAQYARTQNLSRVDARQAIIDTIKAGGEKFEGANPDAAALFEALVSLIETPGQTLTVKLTPLGKVPALQLMQVLKSDPAIALAQFKIEASTGL